MRELKNIVEFAVTLTESDELRLADLPAAVGRPNGALSTVEEDGAKASTGVWSEMTASPSSGAGPDVPARGSESLDERLARTERDLILEALDRAAGVKKHAAVLLGVNYRSLRHRLQKHGITGRSGRPGL